MRKDLVIILISSLPEDHSYLITALETTAEDKLTWDYVRDRLIYEADKIKNGNAGTVVKTTHTNQAALFATNKKPHHKKPADKKASSVISVTRQGTLQETVTRKKQP